MSLLKTSVAIWMTQLVEEERILLVRVAELESAARELQRRQKKAKHLRTAFSELQAYIDEGGTF